MKVRLLVNIGIRDAGELGLTDCTAGAVVSVTNEVAEDMIRRGFAEATEPPQQIEAVPEKPPVAKAKPKTVKAITKELEQATPDEFKSKE